MTRRTLSVEGMACTGCEENVEDAVGSLEGVTSVAADHEDGSLEVVAEDTSEAAVVEAVEAAGYEVVG